MNWKKIKEDCPEAFIAFEYSNINEADGIKFVNDVLVKIWGGIYSENDCRNLFEFFDRREIYIGVFRANNFDWQIFNTIDFWENEETYELRTEAETAAFTKAFEILEEQLKKK